MRSWPDCGRDSMFDLEQAIAEWRRRMLAAGIKTPVPLEELESHLRDDVEAQIDLGTDTQRAFESATRRIGPAMELRSEFQQANRTEPMNEQTKKQLRGILIIIAIIAIEVGLVLPMIARWSALGNTATVMQLLTDQLQAACLAIVLPLSLVLPLMVGALAPRDAGNVLPIMVGALPPQEDEKAKRWIRTVWTGQLLMAAGGLWIILLPLHPMFGFLLAVVSCVVFACKLQRQLRSVAG